MKIIYFISILICNCFILFAGDNSGKYIVDKNSGCLIWNPVHSSADSITWSGGCNEQFADGQGTLVMYEKGQQVSRYEGSMSKGKPNGFGRFVHKSGNKLEGNFTDGYFLNLDKQYLQKLEKNIISTQDTSDLYVNDEDSKELFYYALIPENGIRGVLVLSPGTWENLEHAISSCRDLCQLAFDNGIAVILPSINQRLILNKQILDFLNQIFEKAIKKYKLPKDKFVLGGWSMGGFFSIRYAALAMEDSAQTAIKPRAVFAADCPTDLINLYAKWQGDIINPRNHNKYEPKYAIAELENYIGGTPQTEYDKYVYYSIFSKSEKDGGTAKFLKDMPVRIYNDVDVNWWMKNRGTDLYGMNALDQSAMINYLNGIGNDKAEFINAYGKGIRIEGFRHPHSWSIVDSVECIDWILKCLNAIEK